METKHLPTRPSMNNASFHKSNINTSQFFDRDAQSALFESNDGRFLEEFVWDWPFSDDRRAIGFLSYEKFFVCLPFSHGGTGKLNGTLENFDKIADCNFGWAVGLCSDGLFGTCFWRIEIEILRNLNMLVLNASKDISRPNETSKRLKKVRKVYRLPKHYDIGTLKTASYSYAIIIEANRRTSSPVCKKA